MLIDNMIYNPPSRGDRACVPLGGDRLCAGAACPYHSDTNGVVTIVPSRGTSSTKPWYFLYQAVVFPAPRRGTGDGTQTLRLGRRGIITHNRAGSGDGLATSSIKQGKQKDGASPISTAPCVEFRNDWPMRRCRQATSRQTILSSNNANHGRGLPDGIWIKKGLRSTPSRRAAEFQNEIPIIPAYIMPPMPGAAGIAGVSSGLSAMRHSVVRNIPAMEAAFSRATRATFAGSITPALRMSSYTPVRAL